MEETERTTDQETVDWSGETDRVQEEIREMLTIQQNLIEDLAEWGGPDSPMALVEQASLRRKQNATRLRVQRYMQDLSPIAALPFRTLSHKYALQLAILAKGPLTMRELVEDARLEVEWLIASTDPQVLPRPSFYWSRHWIRSRSEARCPLASGIQYQGIVGIVMHSQIPEADRIEGSILPRYSAILNPNIQDAHYPAIEAPCLFHSMDDAMVWCEKLLDKVAPMKPL